MPADPSPSRRDVGHKPSEWKVHVAVAVWATVVCPALVVFLDAPLSAVFIPVGVPMAFLAGYEYRALCVRRGALPPRGMMWMLKLRNDELASDVDSASSDTE